MVLKAAGNFIREIEILKIFALQTICLFAELAIK